MKKSILILSICAVTLAGCSSANMDEKTSISSDTSAAVADTHGDDHDADISDIDQLSDRSSMEVTVTNGFSRLYSYAPGPDSSRIDAGKRAAEFFTGDVKKSLEDPESLGIKVSANSELWEAWAKSGDTVMGTVTVLDSDTVSHVVKAQVRQVVEHKNMQDSNDKWSPLTPFTVQAHLVEDESGWLIDKFTFIDGSPTY